MDINKPFAIFATPVGFLCGEIMEEEEHHYICKGSGSKVFNRLNKDYLVARFGTHLMAVIQCGKAKALEQQLRPLWLAAIEHERRVKQMMLDAVYACARGD